MKKHVTHNNVSFEIAEEADTYQVVKSCCGNGLELEDKPQRKRKFFWWLRGGWGKPKKLEKMETIEQKPEWRRDWKKEFYKPIQMLTYPQGPGTCDHNAVDRTINLLTTLPYFGVAYHTFKHRKTREGQVWGLSLAGVGLGSIAFHSTSGEARPWGRKLDYWAIALSSISLTRCLFPQTRSSLTAGALAASTFNPLAVSTANAIAMEGKYYKRANANPALRKHHKAHLSSVVLGAGAFIGEEVFPHAPIVHAFWHLCSAYSVATTNYLLADVESARRRLNKQSTSRLSQPKSTSQLKQSSDPDCEMSD